jgi:predicted type IV restriction endonuclease
MGASAPDSVKRLVARFDQNRDAYLSGSYNETQLRHEFLGPFFEALGWDVYNHQGSAMPYRDVIFEDSLKVGGATKAPDYCFRIGGMRKFFVEAKKPSVNIAADAGSAFQLRRYSLDLTARRGYIESANAR